MEEPTEPEAGGDMPADDAPDAGLDDGAPA
jgi:hypothetical protein